MPMLRLCEGRSSSVWPSSRMSPRGRVLEAGEDVERGALAGAGGPRKVRNSPRSTSRVTSWTATMSPNSLRMPRIWRKGAVIGLHPLRSRAATIIRPRVSATRSVEAAAITGVRSWRSVRPDLDRQGLQRRARHEDREHDLVPGDEEGEDRGGEEAVADGRQRDPELRLERARAAEDRRILDRLVEAFERAGDRDDRERQRDDRVGDDEADEGAVRARAAGRRHRAPRQARRPAGSSA